MSSESDREHRTRKGFLSYNHEDDNLSGGWLTTMCGRLKSHLGAFSEEEFEIFVDIDDILPGENIDNRIEEALEQIDFFICVITARYFKSDECWSELDAVLSRNENEKHPCIIIPICFINPARIKQLNSDRARRFQEGPGRIRYLDFSEIRREHADSAKVDKVLSQVAQEIIQLLRDHTPSTPLLVDSDDAAAADSDLLDLNTITRPDIDSPEKRARVWRECEAHILSKTIDMVRISAITGNATFGESRAPFFNALKNFKGEIRILLVSPDSQDLEELAKSKESNIDVFSSYLRTSVHTCWSLIHRDGVLLELRFYETDLRHEKCIFTPDFVFVQAFVFGRDGELEDAKMAVIPRCGMGFEAAHAYRERSIWFTKRWITAEPVDLSREFSDIEDYWFKSNTP